MNKKQFYKEAITLTILGVIASLILLSGIFPFECLFHKYLHIDCPGCGFTRGSRCLLRGDVVQAIKFNPLVVFYPVVIGAILLLIYDLIARKEYLYKISNKVDKVITKYCFIIITIAIVYFIAMVIIKNKELIFG